MKERDDGDDCSDVLVSADSVTGSVCHVIFITCHLIRASGLTHCLFVFLFLLQEIVLQYTLPRMLCYSIHPLCISISLL